MTNTSFAESDSSSLAPVEARMPANCYKLLSILEKWVIAGAFLAVASIFALPLQAQAALPAIEIGSASLVDNSTAYYGSGTTRTNGYGSWTSTTRPAEIKELARALGAGRYSDDEYARVVFEYVVGNIETEFRFGLAKGALGALIDQSGTPFDQAHLMVELLLEGGLTGVTYKAGTISLNGTQFQKWTGITNAVAACRLLADGGIPARINGSFSSSCTYSGNVSSVVLRHIWVSANGKLYDPAYKEHTFKSGINLSSNLSCGTDASSTCGSGANSAITTGAATGTESGVSYYQTLNKSGLDSFLVGKATTLQTYLSGSTQVAKELDDIIGGARIDASAIPTPAANLPYTSTETQFWTGIPNQYRTTLRVQNGALDETFYADEIYGKRLRIFVKTGTGARAALYLEYQEIEEDLAGGSQTLTLTVNHPYAASSGAYMDDVLVQNNAYASGPLGGAALPRFAITIVNGWGTAGRNLVNHFAELQKLSFHAMNVANPSDSTQLVLEKQDYFADQLLRPVTIGPSMTADVDTNVLMLGQPTSAAQWLAQSSMAMNVAAQVNKSTVHNHHSIGIAGGIYSIQSAVSVTSNTNTSSARTATAFTVSELISRLEGSIVEQEQGAYEGYSAASLLTRSNEQGHRFYNVTSANVGSATGLLVNYDSAFITALPSYVNTEGYSIILPKYGRIKTTLPNRLMVASFFGYQPTGSNFNTTFIVNGDYKGSATTPTDPGSEALKTIENQSYSQRNKDAYSFSTATGALTVSPGPDLVSGAGPFPYSLPMQRFYSSANYLIPDVLEADPYPNYISTRASLAPSIPDGPGGGWQHKFQIGANITSDPFQAMGEDSALDASAFIAGLVTLRDLNNATQTFSEHLTSLFVVDWIARQFQFNALAVRRPPANDTFVRLPNGNFNPPPGSQDSLAQTGSVVGPYLPGGGTGYDFSAVSFALTGGQGDVLTLRPEGYGSTGTYANASFLKRAFNPTTWVFPGGVQLTFEQHSVTYLGDVLKYGYLKSVSNNLGRKLTFTPAAEGYGRGISGVTDEDGQSVTYAGGALTAALDTKWTIQNFTVTRPDSSVVTYTYAHNLASATAYRPAATIRSITLPSDPGDPFLQASYDSLGRVKTVTNGENYVTSLYVGGVSTENMRRGEIKDALNGLTTQYFDRQGHILQSTDPILTAEDLLRVTTYQYDGAGRLTRKTLPLGDATEYTYDARHNVLTTTKTAVPGSGLADLVEKAEFASTCTNPKSCNKPTITRDARQMALVPTSSTDRTDYAYDSNGNLTSITGPEVLNGVTGTNARPVTSFTYSTTGKSLGRPLSKTDPVGKVTTYNYDTGTYGNLTSVVDDSAGLALTTSFTAYDAVGNILTINRPSDSNDHITEYCWDSMRRLKRIAQRVGALDVACATAVGSGDDIVTEFIYDLDGQVITKRKRTSTGWQSTVTTYTDTGQVDTVTSPDGAVTNSDYDALDRLSVVTPPVSGRKTKYVYNAVGAVLKEVNAWQGANDNCAVAGTLQQCTVRNTWDANGNKLTVQDANGNLTTYTYNGHGRLTKAEFPHPTNVGQSNPSDKEQYAYDQNGNMTSKVTRAGDTITTAYDALNRATAKTPQAPVSSLAAAPSVTYRYDLTGRQKKVEDSNGLYLEYTYDSAGRNTSVKREDNRIVSYDYDKSGNRKWMKWPDTFQIDYTYDVLDRLDLIKQGTTTLVNYDYDRLSRRQLATFSNGRTVDPEYELDDALDSLAHNFTGTPLSYTFNYNGSNQLTYQSVSDDQFLWTPPANKSDAYVPNGLNQYTSVAGTGFSYDANGNLISDGTGRTYTYDVENRLVAASVPGHSTITYTYDPTGPRRSKTVDSTVTAYVSDGPEEIAEYTVGGTVLRRYVYGREIDDAVVMYDGALTTSPKYWYHQDRQGSIVALTDGTGAIASRFSYSPYGEPGLVDGYLGNPIRYTGRRLDEETGLYYYRARYYSAALGRFLQSDPVGYKDGMNLFAYVKNDPTNKVDPTGLKCALVGQPYDCKADYIIVPAGLTNKQIIAFNNNVKNFEKQYTSAVNDLIKKGKDPTKSSVKVVVPGVGTFIVTAKQVSDRLIDATLTITANPAATGNSPSSRDININAGVLNKGAHWQRVKLVHEGIHWTGRGAAPGVAPSATGERSLMTDPYQLGYGPMEVLHQSTYDAAAEQLLAP